MKTVRLMLKRLLNDRFLLLFSAVFFVGSFGYLAARFVLFKTVNGQPLDYLSATLGLSVFAFVFFMFLSYEYLFKLRAQTVKEVLEATENGRGKFYSLSLLILTGLLAVYCAVLFVFNAGEYLSLDIGKGGYFLHLALNIFLNLFLVPLVGILLGAAISFVPRRVTAYVLMILSVFLSTPMLSAVTDAVYEGTGKSFALGSGFFNIFPPSLGYAQIYPFGFNLLSYRWAIVFFWLFAFSSVLLFCLSAKGEKKRPILSAVCLVLAVFCAVGYFRPASRVTLGNGAQSSGLSDSEYYSSHKGESEKAEFEVKKYSLKLDFGRLLSAEAEMALSKELAEYDFTLYHGYEVKRVRSEDGSALRFEQSGDCFTVFSDGKVFSKIVVDYSGDAPRFFANSQGVSLPGWFPYYPHAGKSEIYDPTVFGFNRFLCDSETEFEVKIHSGKNVFCSLSGKDGEYFGKSEGVTVVSGFYDSLFVGETEVIYPYLATNEFTPEKVKNSVEEYLKSGIFSKEEKKLIVLSGVNMISEYERFCAFSDHAVFLQLNGLSDIYETQKVPSGKKQLYMAYELYKGDKANWKNVVSFFSENVYAGDEEGKKNDSRLILQEYFERFGEDYVSNEIEKFLSDNKDSRDWKTFLSEMRGGKND